MATIENDTIFALASARGVAGVSVIRISGEKALQATKKLLKNKEITKRTAMLKTLFCPNTKQVLDQVILLYFAKPHSFTGEDVVELHCHGSVAVIEAIFTSLLALRLRPAEPGEFSRRAFANGQMDLVQTEGLADLINAKTDGQRQQALQQMGGVLSEHIAKWRSLLLAAIARVEAEIDFPDEEDVTGVLLEQVKPGLAQLQQLLELQITDASRGQTIRDGFLVAIIGPVNAGKSTLLNALAGEDRAIVSELPGTTRDVIEVTLPIGGFLVTVADTAGLRKTDDKIEIEGIGRAKKTAQKADLRLFLSESDTGVVEPNLVQSGDIFVRTKTDIGPKKRLKQNELEISAKTGAGMEPLLQAIENRVMRVLSATELPVLTRARHVQAVQGALDSLSKAEKELGNMPELAAEHLRGASQSLSQLVGEVHTEQVLGEIFSGFCIGK